MNPLEVETDLGEIVEVNWGDRWQVYLRLRELDIPCKCATNQPLRVEVNSVTTALQLWSVVRQLNASRRDLVTLLEGCWENWGY